MPTVRVYAIPSVLAEGKMVSSLVKELKREVVLVFGEQIRNDVAATVLEVEGVDGDADLQVEVHYSAGGKDIDPDGKQREELATRLLAIVHAFAWEYKKKCYSGVRPTVSIWIRPQYNSVFMAIMQ